MILDAAMRDILQTPEIVQHEPERSDHKWEEAQGKDKEICDSWSALCHLKEQKGMNMSLFSWCFIQTDMW